MTKNLKPLNVTMRRLRNEVCHRVISDMSYTHFSSHPDSCPWSMGSVAHGHACGQKPYQVNRLASDAVLKQIYERVGSDMTRTLFQLTATTNGLRHAWRNTL